MIPKNTYVGRRYIPKHCGDWDNSKNTIYESLSVVLWQGASYTSKQDVPKGIDIGNILYWVKSADYNAQVAIYEQNVRDYHQYVIDQIGLINADYEEFTTSQTNNFNDFTTNINTKVNQIIQLTPSASDDTTLIQNAINSGKDVLLVNGNFIVTAPLTINTAYQKITCDNSYIDVRFDGDVFRVNSNNVELDVRIVGTNQPKTGATGSAIIIGYNGSNAYQCSVARSTINIFYGNGVLWENGSMLDFTGVHISHCTKKGILCSNNYDDNNHGFFADTHVLLNGEEGYCILDNATTSNNSSRHHQFINAKGFQNNINFYIETRTNVGTIFSEAGTNPDHFTSTSRGNNIGFIETRLSFDSCIDEGTGNEIHGYSSYGQWLHNNIFVRNLRINSEMYGQQLLQQVTPQSGVSAQFNDTIDGTSNTAVVEVYHDKGTAQKRTDIFTGNVKISNDSGNVNLNGATPVPYTPLNISKALAGVFTLPSTTITAGGISTCYIPSASLGLTNGDTIIINLCCTTAWEYHVQAYGVVDVNGNLLITLKNNHTADITFSAPVIHWVALKH